MPVKELGPHFEFASWRVPQFQRAIEYPPEVMEEIRAFACDELLQLSHGGDDVGGVLFGTRRDDLVRILTWRPIACEHTQGEGLRLSYNDRMNLAVQLEVARQNADLKDLRPVGWFVSHLRGGVALLDSDLEIYNGFFPDAWQVAMVICPKGNGRAQAGFFVREADAKVRADASYQSFELAPLHPPPATPQPPPAPAATKIAATLPPESAVPPPPPAARPKEPESASPRQAEPPKFPAMPPRQTQALQPLAQQAAAPEAAGLQAPSFQIEEDVPTRERWFWAIPILLALGIAAFMLYQRQTPSPNASIALRAWTEAQTVQLSWDATSHAIHDSYRGQIEINDGGKNSQISLSVEQLHSGKMSYVPQSNDVGIVMTVYPTHGDPFHDSTRLIVPSLEAPTQPPQLIPANPAPTAPPPAAAAPAVPPAAPAVDPSGLQQEVQRLKEQLGKERARADELQNLVRILENRLGIQPEPKSTSRP
jgi:proteasome lid subunit RPN8/RPN11